MKRPAGVRWPLLAAWLLAAAASLLSGERTQPGFPHERHAGLFPVCVGCHLGIESGDRSAYYPAPAACSECHDGQRVARVEWTGPSREASNLRFEHPAHARALAIAGADGVACAGCHAEPDAPRMAVEPPSPVACFACHVHAAAEHLVDADCGTCHRPLVESGFAAQRIAGLPLPPTHQAEDFLATHGAAATSDPVTCATCHAREQCLGCHVLSPGGSAVEAVPLAAGRVTVPVLAARYPVPASHREPDWLRRHGAASLSTCALCHTRESCTTCHLQPVPAAVAGLPSGRAVTAPGAATALRPPASHEAPLFSIRHGPDARARPRSCTTCHQRTTFCAACHEPVAAGSAPGGGAPLAGGPLAEVPLAERPLARILGETALHHSTTSGARTPGTPPPPGATHAPSPSGPTGAAPPPGATSGPSASGTASAPSSSGAASAPRGRTFHPANFAAAHSAEAYGRRLDCSSCHNTQLFCRDCHQSAGLGSVGRLGPGYHTAEPIWLLRHGQAARQTLESCVSCHTQSDCMQCHSQLGSFRVSPHGPGFDARRAQRANPQICGACHLGDPLGRP